MSKGHLFDAHGFEYFQFDGSVYRSNLDNALTVNGYRNGARFVCYSNRLDLLVQYYEG